MNIDQFRQLSRGDLVRVGGHGFCVIEAAYYQDSLFKVSVRPKSCNQLYKDIPETEAAMFEPVGRLRVEAAH